MDDWVVPLALLAAAALYLCWFRVQREGLETGKTRYAQIQKQSIEIDALYKELQGIRITKERMQEIETAVQKNEEAVANLRVTKEVEKAEKMS
jgi:hypothetical protein